MKCNNNNSAFYNENEMLLAKTYEMINTFNQNFTCPNVQVIRNLFTKVNNVWQHPLILNYNYCLICYERNTDNHLQINNKIEFFNFFHSRKIAFRPCIKRKDKLSKRRFISSYDSLSQKLSQNTLKIKHHESDTNLLLSSFKSHKPKKSQRKHKREKQRCQTDALIQKSRSNDTKDKEALSRSISMLHNEKDHELEINNQSKDKYEANALNTEDISLGMKGATFRVNPAKHTRKSSFESKTVKKKTSQLVQAKNSLFKFFNMFSRDTTLKNHQFSPRRSNVPRIAHGGLTNLENTTSTPPVLSSSPKNKINLDSTDKTMDLQNNIKNEICEICLGPIKDKFVIGCGDFYCRTCIKSLALDCINNISHFKKLVCPKEICHEPIDEPIIKKLLTEEEFNKYKKIKIRIEGLTNKAYIPCPFPDCDNFAEDMLVKKNIAFCAEGHLFCKNCLEIIQDNEKEHTCKKKKADENQKYFMSNKFIKKCPNCRTWVQREPGGCNNMTCMNIWCNYEFCWICGRAYDNSHYKNPFSVCFGLGESDYKSKFSKYKSARVAKCVIIFLLLIFVAFPIIMIFFSFVVIGIYMVMFVLDGSTMKNVKIKSKLLSKVFNILVYSSYGFISLASLGIGYLTLGILFLVVPILGIVNKCKRQKDEE